MYHKVGFGIYGTRLNGRKQSSAERFSKLRITVIAAMNEEYYELVKEVHITVEQ